MKADQLLEIFYKHIQKNSKVDVNRDEFIHNVVADYIFYLMNIGHIPAKACDELEADLKDEVHELYQKLMAGPIKKVQQTINSAPSKTRRFN